MRHGLFHTAEEMRRFLLSSGLADDIRARARERLQTHTMSSLDYTWYVPPASHREMSSTERYREINDTVGQRINQDIGAAHILALASSTWEHGQPADAVSPAAGGPERATYSAAARRILLAYANEYPCDIFRHWDIGLIHSMVVPPYLAAVDLLFAEFCPAELATLRAFLLRLGAAIRHDQEIWLTYQRAQHCNNHFMWHCTALVLIGLYTGAGELVDYALSNDEGLLVGLRDGFVDDIWLESAMGYNLFGPEAFVPAANALRKAGHTCDLWSMETEENTSLRRALSRMVQMAWPDKTLPRLGDCYARRPALHDSALYTHGWRAYAEPAFGWVALPGEPNRRSLHWGQLPSGDAPAPEKPGSYSILCPKHGFAVLKSEEGPGYWDCDALALAMHFGYTGIHSHLDRLSITVFGAGRELIADHETKVIGKHAFSAEVQGQLNRTTFSHNTVMVDGRGQRGGKTLRVHKTVLDGPTKLLAVVDDGALYEGVRQHRVLILGRDYLVDVFQVRSATEHVYDWLVHCPDDDAKNRVCGITWAAATEPLFPAGASYLLWTSPLETAVTDDNVSAEWRQGTTSWRMHMTGHPGTQLISTGLPLADTAETSYEPLLVCRRHGTEATFVASYGLDVEPPRVRVIAQRPAGLEGLEVRVAAADGTECTWYL